MTEGLPKNPLMFAFFPFKMQKVLITYLSSARFPWRFGIIFWEKLVWPGLTPGTLQVCFSPGGCSKPRRKEGSCGICCVLQLVGALGLKEIAGVFEGCAEPARNIFKKTKDLSCFWGINCNLGEDYSVANSKRVWCNFFIQCLSSLFLLFFCFPCCLWRFLIPFLLMKFAFQKKIITRFFIWTNFFLWKKMYW